MAQKLIDEIGNIYGNLVVLRRERNPKSGKMEWLCRCLNCNQEKFAKGFDLRNGRRTSCGKCRTTIIDETGNIYGRLTVLRQDPTLATEFADKCVHWICECNCENHTICSISGKNLRDGDTRSCGCLKSAGEVMFSSILNELGYKYSTQYSFPDLISPFSKKKLYFDFAIFNESNNLMFLIEYNGEQHEKEIPYFGRSLEYYKANDNKKRDYCANKNIPLFWYTHIKGKLPDREAIKESVQNDYEEILNEISC